MSCWWSLQLKNDMIAIFSGHTEYEVGNVLGDVSEHSVAMKIIADVGTK